MRDLIITPRLENQMQFDIIKRVTIDDRDKQTITIMFMSDVHLGHENHDDYRFQKHVYWAHDNVDFIVLNGDLIECATKKFLDSQILTINEQCEAMIYYLKPLKSKIIGGVEGNHEERTRREMPYSIHRALCKSLNIPNFGIRGLIKLELRRKGSKKRESYMIYIKHGGGSATTDGGKYNKLLKMQNIILNVDIFVLGHVHTGDRHFKSPYWYNPKSNKIEQITQHYACSGHYLLYGKSYGEGKSYAPTGKGHSLIAKFYIDKHKIRLV